MSDKPLTGHSCQVHNHRTGGSPSIWQTPMESYTPWLGLPNGCNYHNDKPAPAQSHKPPGNLFNKFYIHNQITEVYDIEVPKVKTK